MKQILSLLFMLSLLFSCTSKDDIEPSKPDPKPPYVPQHNIAYNIDGNYIRAGKESDKEILFNLDNKYIRVGDKKTGEILFNIDDKYVRIGEGETQTVLYKIKFSYPTWSDFLESATIMTNNNVVLYKINFFYPTWSDLLESATMQIYN